MAMLFSRPKGAPGIDELLRRRQYGKAIELLRASLTERRKDRSLRMKLADVLALAGRNDEAAGILHGLADELALSGFAAQAIALLKRVQSLQPAKPDIEEKLAYLIQQQNRPAPDPWVVGRRPSAPLPPPSSGMPEFGMEEISDDAPELGLFPEQAGDGSSPEPSGGAAPRTSPATATPAEPADGSEGGAPTADDFPLEAWSEAVLRDELVGLIDEVFNATDDSVPPPEAVETPLFRDFTPSELADVIRGLKLRRFEAGEIIVSEGEPGRSLFVLAQGRIRAFVRDAQFRAVEVRQLESGDFFGEAAVLTGQPRSATLTAATDCDLLELDRETLDELAQRQPRVWNVIMEFHKARQDNSLEALIRGRV